MRIGAHMRIEKGFEAAAHLAAEIGCETMQLFAANPGAWRSRAIDPEEAEAFRRAVAEHDLRPVIVHTPYLLNLASPDPEIHAKSTRALAGAMDRARSLGAQYVVTHIGSHRGSGVAKGVAQVCRAVSAALACSDGVVGLLLENSSGAGDSVGARFDELRGILDRLGKGGCGPGICLDTAHLWGAGYDVSTPDAVARTLEEFDSIVGLERLKLVHLNDTHFALGSRRDRHAGIGTGCVGERGFAALMRHPALGPLPGIIETPAKAIEDDVRNISVLNRLRNG